MRRSVFLLFALLAGSPSQVGAELEGVTVIAHPTTELESISRAELAKIYMKRLRSWQNGVRARPVDQLPESPVRRAFSEQVLRRSVVNTEVYWKKMIFSGRAVPPPEVESDERVLDYVLRTPGAVGYVSPSVVLDGVLEVRVYN